MKTLHQMSDKSDHASKAWNEKSILVVDDLKVNYLLVKALLGKTGVSVYWAESGPDAIDILTKGLKIDVVLMDYNMPGMDGMQATFLIKNKHPEMPVISQSTYTDSPHFDRSSAPFDDYLSKPLKSKELMEVIQFYLDKSN